MADLTGRKLGQYEIRDVIGRGGMATVYRAYQPSLDRYVAVKVLNPFVSQDAEFVARFRQEALSAGGLAHPNILRIYDADVVEDRQYIVMAFAPGGTVAQRMRKAGAFSYEQTAVIVAQVAEALAYAHRRGIVHRDIKPNNILLDEEDRPLLADFGIARAIADDRTLTQAGSSIGTPDYMSPEQAEGLRVDGRSDIFSLGIVLYQMVTGKLPFQADTSMAVMFRILHEAPPPPRSVNAAIPLYLDTIVQKALAKDPDHRFQTAQEMAQALRERRVVPVPPAARPRSSDGQRTTPPPATPPRATPPRAADTPRRSARPDTRERNAGQRLLIALLAVALLTLVGAGGYLAWQARRIAAATPATPAAPPPTDAVTAAPPTEAVAAIPPTGAPASPPKAGGVIVAGTTVAAEPAVPPPAPAAVPVMVIASDPTIAPTANAVPTWTAMPPTPAHTSTTAAPTAKPTQAPTTEPRPTTAAAPAAPRPTTPPGIVLDFENFGGWRIGDEPHGSFTASTEQAHGGRSSGKLAYQFPAVAKNYVVFTRVSPASIAGQPAALKLWVYGDGSGHFLNAWVRDSQAEVRQFTFGRIMHSGQWQEMTAALDTAADWPQGHISGPDNGRLDFPIALASLVLDGVPDGGGPFSGAIYIDDLGTGSVVASAPAAPAPAATAVVPAPGAPAPAAPPAAAPPAAAAPSGLGGHIVYASSSGGGTSVSVLDVASRSTWELRGSARQPDIFSNGRVILNGIGGGKDNVYTVTLDGATERLIGMHPEDSYPSWSPTGVSAAFHSSLAGDGKDRIYVHLDATHTEEPRPLLIGKTDVYGKYPTWLETWRIAFTGCNYWNTGSLCGIWTTNSNNSGSPLQVTDYPGDISTDSAGGILLFASPRAGDWDVYAVPHEGGAPRNLTDNPAQDAGGAFSPDHRYIAFMSNRDGGWGIWVMNADGSGPQKLLAVPGFGPQWTEERLAWGP